jgi:acyl carrier protein
MELNNFIENFADQCEESDPKKITSKTKIRDIEGWSSLTVLSVIAMADEKYNVKITGADIRNSESVEDLYNIVNSRIR